MINFSSQKGKKWISRIIAFLLALVMIITAVIYAIT